MQFEPLDSRDDRYNMHLVNRHLEESLCKKHEPGKSDGVSVAETITAFDESN